jgi:hypothetical protein
VFGLIEAKALIIERAAVVAIAEALMIHSTHARPACRLAAGGGIRGVVHWWARRFENLSNLRIVETCKIGVVRNLSSTGAALEASNQAGIPGDG